MSEWPGENIDVSQNVYMIHYFMITNKPMNDLDVEICDAKYVDLVCCRLFYSYVNERKSLYP